MARRGFLQVFIDTLSSAMTAATTSMVVDDITDLSAQDVCIIEEGSTREEIVFVTAVVTATNTATVVRARLGTTAVVHSKGSLVKLVGFKTVVPVHITDVSTAETVCVLPPKGILVKASTVLGEAIATADAVITLYNKTQAITGGAITIGYSGSALGDIDTCTPTVYNEFDGSDDYLKVINGGASVNTAAITVLCELVCVEQD